MELVRHHSGKRLFPVGRLDWETMGLIILTDDGELANRLTHPRYNIPKVYEVAVKGLLSPGDLEKLRKDLRKFEKQVAKRASGPGPAVVSPVEVDIVTQDSQRTLLRITMRESRNREVREMIAAAGLTIRKVERVAIGPLNLGGLRTGAWRDLDRDEVKALYQASGDESKQERTSISTRSMGSFRPVRPKRLPRTQAGAPDAAREIEAPPEKKPVFRPRKKIAGAEENQTAASGATPPTSAKGTSKARNVQQAPTKKGPRVIAPRSY
jgi:23S rRNA pseudouridine2605 synthase